MSSTYSWYYWRKENFYKCFIVLHMLGLEPTALESLDWTTEKLCILYTSYRCLNNFLCNLRDFYFLSSFVISQDQNIWLRKVRFITRTEMSLLLLLAQAGAKPRADEFSVCLLHRSRFFASSIHSIAAHAYPQFFTFSSIYPFLHLLSTSWV